MALDLMQVFGNHGLYEVPIQMRARFVAFKFMRYSNLGGVLPESGVPKSNILISRAVLTLILS